MVAGAGSAAAGLWLLGVQLDASTTPVAIAVVSAAGLGALAPDIDHPRSKASRGVPKTLTRAGGVIALPVLALTGALTWAGVTGVAGSFERVARGLLDTAALLVLAAFAYVGASTLLRSVTRHRGATHSLVAVVIVTASAAWVCSRAGVSEWVAWGFGWGWFTHLALDLGSLGRVPGLLWPFRR